MAPRPLRVMQSFRTPRPTTNPYIVMLDQALAAEPTIGWDNLIEGYQLRGFTLAFPAGDPDHGSPSLPSASTDVQSPSSRA